MRYAAVLLAAAVAAGAKGTGQCTAILDAHGGAPPLLPPSDLPLHREVGELVCMPVKTSCVLSMLPTRVLLTVIHLQDVCMYDVLQMAFIEPVPQATNDC